MLWCEISVIRIFPHLVLMQPDGVGVLANKLIRAHTVDGRRSFDSLLLAIHENIHVLLLSSLLCSLLGCSKFAFQFRHGTRTITQPRRRMLARVTTVLIPFLQLFWVLFAVIISCNGGDDMADPAQRPA